MLSYWMFRYWIDSVNTVSMYNAKFAIQIVYKVCNFYRVYVKSLQLTQKVCNICNNMLMCGGGAKGDRKNVFAG